jgi:hypothetical protein
MSAWLTNNKKVTSQGEKAKALEVEAYNEVFDKDGQYIGYPIYQMMIDWQQLGNPPTWCEATANYIESTGLCGACSKYDFKALLKELGKTNPNAEENAASSSFKISLGTIGDLASRSDCSFCQFLLMVAVHLYPAGVPCDAICTLRRGDNSWETHASLFVECPAASAINGDSFISKGRELALWRDYPMAPGTAPRNPTANGPPMDEFMLLSMVAWLLEGCIKTHPKCRQQASLGLKLTTQMYVVDIQELKIVQALENCKYAALSYVWGHNTADRYRINPVKASTDTVVEFPIEIPATIHHALNVSKQLGFRYLWVDQLCVPSDARLQQIAEMDKIYRNATLTLVAAVEDAESGLPGVGYMNRKRFAPPILRINDLNIGIKMPPSVFRALENSHWTSRGWTYQEKVLSSRLLYFTEEDIYYACLEGEKGEHECHAENPVSFTRDTLVELGGVLTNAHGRVPFQIFGDCVSVYTRRNLTYLSDILNGFAGLMSFLSEKFEWVFCWGLPNDNFALALLWTSPSTSRREARDSQNRLFPSWSWAGWLGPASYNFSARGIAQADGLFPDFSPVSWDLDMLEKASESGILVLWAECTEITMENRRDFQVPESPEQSRLPQDDEVWIGSVFVAIVLLVDTEPLVEGLIITKPKPKSDDNIAQRIGTASLKPELWLAMQKEKKTIELS